MSEIDDRRQRAREAAWDEIGDAHTMQHHRDAIESGVIVATQVKITNEAIEAFGHAWRAADPSPTRETGARRRAGLTAALTALGLDVIE